MPAGMIQPQCEWVTCRSNGTVYWHRLKTTFPSLLHGQMLQVSRVKPHGPPTMRPNSNCVDRGGCLFVASADTPIHDVAERIRSMLSAWPRAVNFPVLHYGGLSASTSYASTRRGVANVDYTVLDLLSHVRTQGTRHILYAQLESSAR